MKSVDQSLKKGLKKDDKHEKVEVAVGLLFATHMHLHLSQTAASALETELLHIAGQKYADLPDLISQLLSL